MNYCPTGRDDWLLLERERWDQVRLHILESLARHLLETGHYLAALEAAITAVSIEPIRESANRTVMEVYIAEGNPACATASWASHRPHRMDRLVHPLGAV